MRSVRPVAFVVALLVVGSLGPAASGSGSRADQPAPAEGSPKSHPELQELEQEYARDGSVDGATHREKDTPVYGQLVTISAVPTGSGDELLADLEALGLKGGTALPKMVTGRLPVASLEQAEGLDSLQYMRPDWFQSGAGAITSQGDPAMKADDARAAFGVNGTGVKVGTLSDTYNRLGGASSDVASGDLPAGVQVLEEGPNSGASDEGRAMMQHIHDVAPGATQAFHSAFLGQGNFAQGIIDLKNAGAGVINDDVFYFAEPFFQDGVIAQAIDTVTAGGASYFSAAGNQGRQSYESAFRDTGVVGRDGTMHDFDPTAGTDTRQRLTIAPGSSIAVFLQWDDPFGTHAPSTNGPASDIDMYLFSSSGALLRSSVANNITTLEPIESIFFQNTGRSSMQVDLQIERFSGPVPGLIKWIDFDGGATVNQFATNSSTAIGHANAAGAMSTGAAFWAQTPDFGVSPPVLESYSSAGGTSILFGTNGVRLPQPSARQTPDFTGPDGGNTTFFGQDIGNDADTFPNFFGTSAAAPHVAGVAALAIDKVAGAGPSDVCNALSLTAVNMGPAGYDFDSGFGLVNANAALTMLTAPGLGGPCAAGGAPQITITDVSANEGNSGTTSFNFSVALSQAPIGTNTATVQFATANGTATQPGDFTSNSGPLTFSAASPGPRTVTVAVVGDAVDEANETFFVNLTSPACTGSGCTTPTLADNQGLGTIVNDDGAVVRAISINDVSVTEGGLATFTISATNPGAAATLNVATSNGSATAPGDYTAVSTTPVTIDSAATTAAFSVQTTQDTTSEPTETFFLNLSSPSTNATITDAQGQATILDNDGTPGVRALSVNDVSVTEGGLATFTVSATNPGAQATVQVTTSNGSATAGSDYTAISGGSFGRGAMTVTIGASATTATVSVQTTQDTAQEPSETFFLNLASPSANATITDAQGQATIIDDDGAVVRSISVNDVSVTEGGLATFTISATNPGAAATLNVATSNGSATAPGDYTAVSTTPVTIDSAATTAAFSVQTTQDTTSEPTETFFLNLSSPSTNATITDAQGQATILDNDGTPGVRALSVNDVSVTEGGLATFTVSATNPGAQATVQVTTSNGSATAGSDYTAISGGSFGRGAMTVTIGASATTATVSVQTTQDTAQEPSETFFLNLASPSANATITDAQGQATIIDND